MSDGHAPQARTGEERLARLEEENYFLQKRLDDLNEVLTLQQKQLDTLERELARTRDALARLRDAVGGNAPVNTPPPHYNTW